MGQHPTRSTASVASIEMENNRVEVILLYNECCRDIDIEAMPGSPCDRGICAWNSEVPRQISKLLWESKR